jgi:cell division septation protein DedD
MKKLLLLTAISSFYTAFSQISISNNIPSNVSIGSNIDVDVKINKGGIGNFAKYQIDVPEGYSVFSTDNKGGNFTFDQQRAKIVWVSVPSEPEFTIKFKFLINSNALASGTFSQKFFYLENNEKREYEATPITVTVGGGAVASNNNNNTSTSVETVKSTPIETVKSTPVETVKSTPVETVKSTPVETVKSTETVKSSNAQTTTSSSKSTAISSSEAGVTYKIQLGAFSTQPNKSKFAAAGNINVDMIDGLYKVTSGNFNNRAEAEKHRDNLQNKGMNGFIVKYKDGKRVN